MVDFQERDTRRGIEDVGAGAADGEDGDGGGDEGGEAEAGQGEDADHGHGHDHGHEHGHDEGSGHHAHDLETFRAAVVTISSSRSLDDDPAGDAIVEILEDDGDEIITRDLIRDDLDGIQQVVDALVGRDDVDVVITTGGTGASPDDVTPEAVRPLLDKPLPGFGELFRQLSYEEIGSRVVGTRAIAGIADGVPIFCLPGSENAARLGTGEIVVAEAGHLAGLAAVPEDEEELEE